ncbi:uncharacterized protein LOC141647250 isoform X1 [Silene latifolia]|uniref:uncharacterized protein LOC141647250 isoform X1 n=1 Tax=Silene latifolia TaxID=37657 RepID=UPI003D7734F0
MAGISCYIAVSSTSNYKRINTIRSCSNPPTYNSKNQTPSLLKFAVSGVTEVLRIFSTGNNNGMDRVMAKEKEELSVSGVDDVLGILKSDYDNAYFVTGTFSLSIYAGDCLFEDPTIKFRGIELYSRNIQLLVPFFEQPSIVLNNIDKVRISCYFINNLVILISLRISYWIACFLNYNPLRSWSSCERAYLLLDFRVCVVSYNLDFVDSITLSFPAQSCAVVSLIVKLSFVNRSRL